MRAEDRVRFYQAGRVQEQGSEDAGARPARARSPLGGYSDLCRPRTDEDAGGSDQLYREQTAADLSVSDLRSESVRRELLPTVPVEEVWGIGGPSAAKQLRFGHR